MINPVGKNNWVLLGKIWSGGRNEKLSSQKMSDLKDFDAENWFCPHKGGQIEISK